MTVVPKSPEQLNAEAAATGAIRAVITESTRYSPMGVMPQTVYCGGNPHYLQLRDRHGSYHQTMCCLIHEARLEWHYAHPDDLHVRRVPSDLEAIPVIGEVLDAGELGGPPYAIPFLHYLDWPDEALVRGLREQRRLCASRHSTRPDHRGRVVCGTLLWSVVANGNPIVWAADEIDLTPERATDLIGTALRAVWTWRSREANGLKTA